MALSGGKALGEEHWLVHSITLVERMRCDWRERDIERGRGIERELGRLVHRLSTREDGNLILFWKAWGLAIRYTVYRRF